MRQITSTWTHLITLTVVVTVWRKTMINLSFEISKVSILDILAHRHEYDSESIKIHQKPKRNVPRPSEMIGDGLRTLQIAQNPRSTK